MLINEITRTDEIGQWFKDMRRGSEIRKIKKSAKSDSEAKAIQLRDQWIRVATSKGIKWPDPTRDQRQGPDGQYTGETYAQRIQNIEQDTVTDTDGMEEAEYRPVYDKNPARQTKIEKIKKVKYEWFVKQVYNPNVPQQVLKPDGTGGGYYYSKLRKFLTDNGIRAGTIDKIARGLYPEVDKLHKKFEKVYDDPKREISKHLDSVFIKVMQKATDYHGNFYGAGDSKDAIAKSKGNIDPDLIDNIKDLSPEQKLALADILAGGLGRRLVNPDTDGGATGSNIISTPKYRPRPKT